MRASSRSTQRQESLCEDFGQDGQVSLKTGMGPFKPGLYYVTSPPAISHGLAIVVEDLFRTMFSVGEPSGVIRAFDARSGKFAWAWDMGRRADETGEPPDGKSTRWVLPTHGH